MFEKASRMKLRFETNKGLIGTEELWDMRLTSKNGFSLDDLAKSINKQLKESAEESFVETKSAANTELELKLNIVKHVIKYKVDMAALNEKAKDRKKLREKLLSIKENKEDEALNNLSAEEIQAMLDKL